MAKIEVDPSGIVQFLSGNKTYITLVTGMLVVAANHFGVLPSDMVPALDPKDWVNDEFKLLTAAFFRAGIAKAGSSVPAKEVVAVPAQTAPAAQMRDLLKS